VKIPSEEDICKFIKERQENLTIDDFLFKQGLAGLGFAIIKYHISLYK
jgi:hypothetical protein